MVLTSMRKGFISVIFMALLLLGGAGLIVSDAGGFFRGGVGRTDVAKIGSEKITAIQFDRQVRRLLQGQQITAQDAFKAGLIQQYLQTEIAKILIAKESKELGIEISDEMIAKQIKDFIAQTPIPETDPKKAFALLLQQQGLNEAEFVAQLRNEVAAQITMKAISGLSATDVAPPVLLTEALYSWFSIKRDIDYIDLKFADQPLPAAPTDTALAAFYNDIKDEYALPELRDFTVAIFSPKNFSEKNDEQIFEMINQIDERLEAGETFEQLKDEFKLTATPVKALARSDLPEALMFLEADAERLKTIAFETAAGAHAPLTELANGDMAAVMVDEVKPASFKPLASVKEDVLKAYKIKAQEDAVIASAQKIIDTVNKEKISLSKASGKIVTRQEGVSRAVPAPQFTMLDVQKIMEPAIGQAVMLRTANSVQVVVPVSDSIPDLKASPSDLEQIGKAMKLDFTDEIQDELLARLQTKYKVSVNETLLNQMYGAQAAE